MRQKIKNLLLLLQVLRALDGLLTPVLVLLGHAVNIVGDVVDRLAQWISRLTQDLNRLLHKFDVLVAETTTRI